MAAVVVNRRRAAVMGSKRVVLSNLDINNTDTFATKLHLIESFRATSTAANAIGGTVSGGVITFATSGAEAGALVEVIGL